MLFTGNTKTLDAGMVTDPVTILPKLPCCSDISSSSSSASAPKKLRSKTDKRSAHSSRSRDRPVNCSCNDCAWEVCSRPSSTSLRISRHCGRHFDHSSTYSCQSLPKSRQNGSPEKTLGPSFKTYHWLVENSSEARCSSHSSRSERASGRHHCHSHRAREVSSSHERLSSRPHLAKKSRQRSDTGMSGNNQSDKNGHPSGYKRSKQMSPIEDHPDPSGYKRSKQMSPIEDHPDNFTHAHARAVNHSSSRRSRKSTSRKRPLQHSGSNDIDSASRYRRLETSMVNWQSRYSHNLAVLPCWQFFPVWFPLLYSSFHYLVLMLFHHLLSFFPFAFPLFYYLL